MSKARKLLLTDHCIREIAAIERFSVSEWGRKVAKKYIQAFEDALSRIQADPRILSKEEQFHDKLRFYRVNKHILVCDLQDSQIVVLTVIHDSMDTPSRLADLEPTLATEIELLHRTLRDQR